MNNSRSGGFLRPGGGGTAGSSLAGSTIFEETTSAAAPQIAPPTQQVVPAPAPVVTDEHLPTYSEVLEEDRQLRIRRNLGLMNLPIPRGGRLPELYIPAYSELHPSTIPRSVQAVNTANTTNSNTTNTTVRNNSAHGSTASFIVASTGSEVPNRSVSARNSVSSTNTVADGFAPSLNLSTSLPTSQQFAAALAGDINTNGETPEQQAARASAPNLSREERIARARREIRRAEEQVQRSLMAQGAQFRDNGPERSLRATMREVQAAASSPVAQALTTARTSFAALLRRIDNALDPPVPAPVHMPRRSTSVGGMRR